MTRETELSVAASTCATDLSPPKRSSTGLRRNANVTDEGSTHLRADLVIREIDAEDGPLVVVKDPRTHVLVRLGPVEWSLARRFDDSTSLDRVLRDVEAEEHVTLDRQDVLEFVARFRSLGFLDDTNPEIPPDAGRPALANAVHVRHETSDHETARARWTRRLANLYSRAAVVASVALFSSVFVGTFAAKPSGQIESTPAFVTAVEKRSGQPAEAERVVSRERLAMTEAAGVRPVEACVH